MHSDRIQSGNKELKLPTTSQPVLFALLSHQENVLEVAAQEQVGGLKVVNVRGDEPEGWLHTMEQVYPLDIPLTWYVRQGWEADPPVSATGLCITRAHRFTRWLRWQGAVMRP